MQGAHGAVLMRPHPKFDASGLECEHCIAEERSQLRALLAEVLAELDGNVVNGEAFDDSDTVESLKKQLAEVQAENDRLDRAVITANKLTEAAHADRRLAESKLAAAQAEVARKQDAYDNLEGNFRLWDEQLRAAESKLTAERDRLRGLLHRARTLVDFSGSHPFLVADIDAALGEATP